jgi:hypothetical protein
LQILFPLLGVVAEAVAAEGQEEGEEEMLDTDCVDSEDTGSSTDLRAVFVEQFPVIRCE